MNNELNTFDAKAKSIEKAAGIDETEQEMEDALSFEKSYIVPDIGATLDYANEVKEVSDNLSELINTMNREVVCLTAGNKVYYQLYNNLLITMLAVLDKPTFKEVIDRSSNLSINDTVYRESLEVLAEYGYIINPLGGLIDVLNKQVADKKNEKQPAAAEPAPDKEVTTAKNVDCKVHTKCMLNDKANISCNNRAILPKGVNKDFACSNIYEDNNTTFIEAFKRLFDSSVEKYNETQRRKERKIADYHEKLFGKKLSKSRGCVCKDDKGRQNFYEIVLSIDCVEPVKMMSLDGVDKPLIPVEQNIAVDCFKEYFDSFTCRNPHMAVFNASIHLDENVVNMHLDFIPFINDESSGKLAVRHSINGALRKTGFSGKLEDSLNNFIKRETKFFNEICKGRGLTVLK